MASLRKKEEKVFERWTQGTVSMDHCHTWILPIGVAGNDYILSARQRAAWKGLKCFPPHDNAMPHGDFLEVAHVSRQMAQQVTLAPNGPITGDGNYGVNGFHLIQTE